MHRGFGQPVAHHRQKTDEAPPLQQRLAARKADGFRSRIDKLDALGDLVEDPSIIDVLRRLRAHQAIMVATLRHQKRVVLRGPTVKDTQPQRSAVDPKHVPFGKMAEPLPEPNLLIEAWPFPWRPAADYYGLAEPGLVRRRPIRRVPDQRRVAHINWAARRNGAKAQHRPAPGRG
jgi:hypothetical protein